MSTNEEVSKGKGVGDDIRQIGVVVKYEIYKHLRSRRMLIFTGLALLVFALMTVLSIYLDGSLPDDPTELASMYLGFISLLIIIGVSLFCAPTIAAEFEERTALLMFPRPIRKTSFFLGKVLACYIICGLIVGLYYLITVVVSLANTGSVDTNLFLSLGYAMLFMIAAGGFALLLSSLLKKGSTAVIVTIAVLLLVFNIIDGMMMVFHVEPIFSLTYAGLDISNIVDGRVTTLIDFPELGMSISNYYPSHNMSAFIMVVWASVTTMLSAALFHRREF
ncbi:MAG: ABC transporter permease [Methanomassiliicoccaceae archaeon]|nr:ABC transporter permease [Methanomassiliicoccaceae archaeon]